jgi:hypothetical protein
MEKTGKPGLHARATRTAPERADGEWTYGERGGLQAAQERSEAERELGVPEGAPQNAPE